MKTKLISENYENCLEATELGNEIIQPEKNKVNIDSLKESHEEFIKKQ